MNLRNVSTSSTIPTAGGNPGHIKIGPRREDKYSSKYSSNDESKYSEKKKELVQFSRCSEKWKIESKNNMRSVMR